MAGLPVDLGVSVGAGADGFDVRPIRRPTQIEGGGRIAPFGVIGQIFELAEIDLGRGGVFAGGLDDHLIGELSRSP